MTSTTYKFNYKQGILDNQIFITRDYFEYYTTGIEKLVPENIDNFQITDRQNAERPENIMYELFNDANLADLFVGINNQNYLWATPFDLDAFQDAIDFRMNYIELLMRTRILKIPVLDDNGEPTQDINGINEYTYNKTGDECLAKVSDDIHNEDDKARLVIIPAPAGVTNAKRFIRDYFRKRVVK